MPSRRALEKRRGSSYIRKLNTREPRQSFLIVCEGTKTEPNYFQCFRTRVVVIRIKGVAEDPRNLIAQATEEKKDGDYDQVWCVFDRDAFPPDRFNAAIAIAENKGFGVAYSNESFELWYLLHFELCNGPITRADCITKLERHLGHSYEKNSATMYADLLDRQSVAVTNAQKLLSRCSGNNPATENPSTKVHLLVLELNKHNH